MQPANSVRSDTNLFIEALNAHDLSLMIDLFRSTHPAAEVLSTTLLSIMPLYEKPHSFMKDPTSVAHLAINQLIGWTREDYEKLVARSLRSDRRL